MKAKFWTRSIESLGEKWRIFCLSLQEKNSEQLYVNKLCFAVALTRGADVSPPLYISWGTENWNLNICWRNTGICLKVKSCFALKTWSDNNVQQKFVLLTQIQAPQCEVIVQRHSFILLHFMFPRRRPSDNTERAQICYVQIPPRSLLSARSGNPGERRKRKKTKEISS